MSEVINKSDIYDYIHEGFSGNQILDMIVFNEIPTVKAVPIDRLKQFRNEVMNMNSIAIIQRLDKLIAESEEK